jgi:molybdopterin synthase catalytic subunit
MDYLKTRAPFWKKETLADGTARWVEAQESDDAAAEAWDTAKG